MINLLLKSVFRSLIRQRLYTFINIIGLTIGILSFTMIMLYVTHEASYDNFHLKKERIYRLTSANKERAGAITPYVWGLNLKNDFPEIENYTTFQILALTTKKEDEVFAEDKVVTADSTFFDLFDFPIVEGNQDNFLKSPNKMLITPETALRYFSDEEPVGQTLEVNLYGTFVHYEVEGVVECPKNSHLQFDFLIPIHLVKKYSNNPWAYDHWRAHFVNTYLLLSENAHPEIVRSKFGDFLLAHAGKEVQETYTPDIQPLADIYQKSTFPFDFQPRGNERNAQILRLVAFGILLIAMINFINITSAQSLRRAKEVGLKKVLGIKRISLIGQFIAESTMVSFLASLASMSLAIVILPFINDLTAKDFGIAEVFTLRNVFFMIALSLLVGVISGLYPALLLSSYKSVSMLNSRSASKSKGIIARKILVVVQFSLAVVLLISTGVIYKQVQYIQNKDLGFDQEQVIVVNDGGEVSSNLQKTQLLRDELTKLAAVHTVSASSTYPGKQTWSMRYIPEGFDSDNSFSLSTIFADHDFLKTYGVRIIKGRDLDREVSGDSTAFLINEAAVKFLSNVDTSWLEKPLQKELNLVGFSIKDQVIGVFEDFHFESLKNEIGPLVIQVFPNNFHSVQMRVSPGNIQETIGQIENTWKKLYPAVPFNYRFVDEEFGAYVNTDQQLGKILQLFAILSIVVALLGLFGLASSLAFEKAKEMSIRKVIGASEKQLVQLLAWLFLRLVFVANIIALPVSYFLMSNWLEGFAYRAQMPYVVFFLAVGTTLFVALATVAYHSIRIATLNPAQVLAQE